MDDTWLAYCAGLLDGEGNIYISPRNDKTRCWAGRVRIANIDIRPLKLLRESFGGSIQKIHSPRGRRTCWHWCIGGPIAEDFLRLVLPFLIIKKEEAEVFLEYRDTFHDSAHHRIINSDIERDEAGRILPGQALMTSVPQEEAHIREQCRYRLMDLKQKEWTSIN